VRRHRQDREAGSGRLLPRADRGGRLEAVHLRHLDIHQDDIEALPLQGGQRLTAVGGEEGRVPRLLEEGHHQALVDGIVLDDEDPQRARELGRRHCVLGGAGFLRSASRL
jgi:hypothetical protein